MLRSSKVKSLFLIAIFSILFLTNCEHSTNPEPVETAVQVLLPINVEWDQTKSIVCFGTSLTYGFEGFSFFDDINPVLKVTDGYTNGFLFPNETENISIYNGGFPHYLDSLLNIKVYNKGYVGARVDYALSVLSDSVLAKNPALILLEFPANDFLSGRDIPTVRAKMILLIEEILNYGSKIVLVSFVDEKTVNNPPADHILFEKKEMAMDYFNMLKSLAEDYNLLFIKDCFNGVFGVEGLMGDQYHPNSNGYIKMARNIEYSLKRTFELNRMYR